MTITIPKGLVPSLLEGLKQCDSNAIAFFVQAIERNLEEDRLTEEALEKGTRGEIEDLVNRIQPGLNRFRLLCKLDELEKK